MNYIYKYILKTINNKLKYLGHTGKVKFEPINGT